MKNINIIPQVYYDLIARLIPGAIILLSTATIYYGPNIMANNIKNLIGYKDTVIHTSFTFIMIFSLLSYTVAILAMGIWSLFVKLSKKTNLVFLKDDDILLNETQNKLKNDLQNASQIVQIREDPHTLQVPSLAFIYDFIRFRAPDVGARLVKVRAECHMCAVLVTGLTILSIIHLIILILNPTISKIVLECVFLLGCIAFWYFMRDLEQRFMTGICNYWAILQVTHNDQTNDNSEVTE